MSNFFVIKVIYKFQSNNQKEVVAHQHAGPFNTKQEAQMVADAENTAKLMPGEKDWFYNVGTMDEIGRTESIQN